MKPARFALKGNPALADDRTRGNCSHISMPGPRVTILDVAQATGFSKSTVSRALSGHPRISQATRDAVTAVANRLGYRPDPALRALCAYRTSRTAPGARDYAVAVLEDFPLYPAPGNFHRDLIDSTLQALRDLGYVTHLFHSRDYARAASLANVMQSRGVRGVVAFAIHHKELAEEFPWGEFATVLHSQPFFAPSVHMVREDRFDTVARALALARERGYVRPGLAMLSFAPSQHLVWQTGAWYSNHVPGEAVLEPLHILNPRDLEPLRAWLAREKPDVVLCDNPVFLYLLEEVGKRVPDDIALICLLRHGLTENKRTAGYDTPIETTATTLAKQLDLLLRHGQVGLQETPLSILVRQQFHEGPTLPQRAPARPAAAKRRAAATAG